jgi:ABC-type transporter Mla maintaining outer membrane lipid asymmetry permease subunit MlaE
VIASLLSAPPAYLVVAILAIGGACLSTAMIVYLFTRWYYLDRLTVALYFEQFGRALWDAHLSDEVWRRIEEEDGREAEGVRIH